MEVEDVDNDAEVDNDADGDNDADVDDVSSFSSYQLSISVLCDKGIADIDVDD